MDSIIRGTNATIRLTLKDNIDFSTITSLELYLDQPGSSIVKTLSIRGNAWHKEVISDDHWDKHSGDLSGSVYDRPAAGK